MFRPLHEQVIVLTGASSGIGRVAALRFAERGAALVIASRNEEALGAVAEELRARGARIHVVPTDVSDSAQVTALAQQAVDTFGRIDTWINDAGVSMFGTVDETDYDELEQVIRVTLLGTMYGMKAAVPHLRANGGGKIINLGSVASQIPLPLQAPYAAAKHGVKGFADTLRIELEHERANIDITTILPASINTPFFANARSRMGAEPQPMPPIYAPEIVADAIVFAAQHPQRDIYVGGASKAFTVLHSLFPSLAEFYMLQGGRAFQQQRTNVPAYGEDNLFSPVSGTGRTHGRFGGQAADASPYTTLFELYTGWQKLFIPLLIAGAFVAAARARRQPKPRTRLETWRDTVETLADDIRARIETMQRA